MIGLPIRDQGRDDYNEEEFLLEERVELLFNAGLVKNEMFLITYVESRIE